MALNVSLVVGSLESAMNQNDDEPLLHFSFAKYLINPCGFMSSSSSNDDNKMVASSIGASDVIKSRLLTAIHQQTTDDIASPISHEGDEDHQEALDLIETVRQQYDFNGSLFSNEEERLQLVKEFLLIFQEVKYRTQLLYTVGYYFFLFSNLCCTQTNLSFLKDLSQCENILPSSLPNVDRLMNDKVYIKWRLMPF